MHLCFSSSQSQPLSLSLPLSNLPLLFRYFFFLPHAHIYLFCLCDSISYPLPFFQSISVCFFPPLSLFSYCHVTISPSNNPAPNSYNYFSFSSFLSLSFSGTEKRFRFSCGLILILNSVNVIAPGMLRVLK